MPFSVDWTVVEARLLRWPQEHWFVLESQGSLARGSQEHPPQKGGWEQSPCRDLCPLSSRCLTPLCLISGCSQGAFHPSDTSVASTHHPLVRKSSQSTAPWCQHRGGLPTPPPPPALQKSPLLSVLRIWTYLELVSLQIQLVQLGWSYAGVGWAPNPLWLVSS